MARVRRSRRAWSAAGPPAPWPRRAAARRKSSARHWHAGASPRIGRRRPEASRPTARGRRLRQRRPRARLRLDLVQRAADGWVRIFRRLDAPRVALRVGLGLLAPAVASVLPISPDAFLRIVGIVAMAVV